MTKFKCADLYKHQIERFLEIGWSKEIEIERVISNKLERALSCIKYEQAPIQVCLVIPQWQHLGEKFTRDLGGDDTSEIHLARAIRSIYE